jgi:hypothetical protein
MISCTMERAWSAFKFHNEIKELSVDVELCAMCPQLLSYAAERFCGRLLGLAQPGQQAKERDQNRRTSTAADERPRLPTSAYAIRPR